MQDRGKYVETLHLELYGDRLQQQLHTVLTGHHSSTHN